MNQHANIPATINVAHARLPVSYEQAKAALANCDSLDECSDWANRAEALASYARQADDDSLRQLADRIQARAVRRAGELLKTFDGRGRPTENNVGAHGISQREAAAGAGMSEHQQLQAVRVANVPATDFETAVESNDPPTITKLAEIGKQSRPVPEGFKQATHVLGAVKRFSDFCAENAPEFVAGGVMPSEASEVRAQVTTIDAWLDRFVINLKA